MSVCHLTQDEDWNVEMKADDSPLTRADREANAVICDGLAALGMYLLLLLVFCLLHVFTRETEFEYYFVFLSYFMQPLMCLLFLRRTSRYLMKYERCVFKRNTAVCPNFMEITKPTCHAE